MVRQLPQITMFSVKAMRREKRRMPSSRRNTVFDEVIFWILGGGPLCIDS